MKLTTRHLRRIIEEEVARIVEDANVDKELGEYIDAWKEEVQDVRMDEQPPADDVVNKAAVDLKGRIEGIAANYEERARGAEMKRREDKRVESGPSSSRRPGVKESKAVSALKQFIRETIVHA